MRRLKVTILVDVAAVLHIFFDHAHLLPWS
jgi:hypothetical protein